ncbi:hypothetical protein IWQ60_006748 [Tieghemiomyces parasiticus]|uniref:Aldehyde dehydrogenase domain-containing protein n=1 Tax=Tieghemiomyces parasiticus TaxID=78921 RepID=A0A9W8AAC4_9FUNG|nr:hypothetical protein IWQ60_006748 [Tieghemiomyces parasiticus]
MSPTQIKVVNPYLGEVVATRPLADRAEITAVVDRAVAAFPAWRATPLEERIAVATRFRTEFKNLSATISRELALQMGRPIRYGPGEVNGVLERATHMTDLAPTCLARRSVPGKPGFERFITKEPVGVVLVIAPWNFPYLVTINAVLPALLAGNTVVLKHAPQTPLCAERLAEAFHAAGLPPHVLQCVQVTNEDCDWAIEHLPINFVNFTGSVAAGREVSRAACRQLLGTGLELGGKDPAYVRPDADVAYAAEQLADGAFFNSGQSCCSVERIYVHAAVYDQFVDAFVAVAAGYRPGSPEDSTTTLGPVINAQAANRIRAQVAAAVAQGARPLLAADHFGNWNTCPAMVTPQVLVDVDHTMSVMTEETFGPVVGIMRVADDNEAVQLMNDSKYGLTASVWTRDTDAALALGDRVQTGTWFMNRCDVLDPALPWTGVKESGRGCSLSEFGFDQFVQLKSYHLKLPE